MNNQLTSDGQTICLHSMIISHDNSAAHGGGMDLLFVEEGKKKNTAKHVNISDLSPKYWWCLKEYDIAQFEKLTQEQQSQMINTIQEIPRPPETCTHSLAPRVLMHGRWWYEVAYAFKKKIKKNGEVMFYVHWIGYPNKFDSWQDRDQLRYAHGVCSVFEAQYTQQQQHNETSGDHTVESAPEVITLSGDSDSDCFRVNSMPINRNNNAQSDLELNKQEHDMSESGCPLAVTVHNTHYSQMTLLDYDGQEIKTESSPTAQFNNSTEQNSTSGISSQSTPVAGGRLEMDL